MQVLGGKKGKLLLKLPSEFHVGVMKLQSWEHKVFSGLELNFLLLKHHRASKNARSNTRMS